MIDANDPDFSARYPHGAIVRDRWGRQIPGVVACNPETGEVISYDGTWLLWLTRRLRVGVTRHPFHWAYPCRHGFWPAPLTVEGRRPVDFAAIRDRLADGSNRPGGLTLAQLDDLILAVDAHP